MNNWFEYYVDLCCLVILFTGLGVSVLWCLVRLIIFFFKYFRAYECLIDFAINRKKFKRWKTEINKTEVKE